LRYRRLHGGDVLDHPVTFTPTNASWLNLIARWLALITGQAIRLGSCDSVNRLEAAIMRWVSYWNGRTVSLDEVSLRY
jgi:hypothetical protein